MLVITGMEGSGSKLIMRTLCNAVYDKDWWQKPRCVRDICHYSLPMGKGSEWYDLNDGKFRNAKFIICTRDRSISEKSRLKYHHKDPVKAYNETTKALEVIKQIMIRFPYYLWSYESFMLLGLDYLALLYKWLGVKSNYMPDLKDANMKYITNEIDWGALRNGITSK